MSVARRHETSAITPPGQRLPVRDRAILRYLALAIILALYGGLAWGYALVTPPWNNPDEPAHFNYVAHIATTGTLPVLQVGDWDAAALERLKSTRFAGGESVAAIRYESWQPPLYYLAAAPVYALVQDRALLTRVRALRLFGVLLGGATLMVAYLVAREAFGRGKGGSAGAALAVPLVISGVPMFTAVSGAITNDVLANLMGAVLTLALLRLLASDRPAVGPTARGLSSHRAALALGALLGCGLLTKLTLAMFVPLALAVVAYRALMPLASQPIPASGSADPRATAAAGHRGTSAPLGGSSPGWSWVLPRLGWLMVGLLLPLLPWLIRQGLIYGWDDLLATRRHDLVVVGQARFPGLSADYAWRWATTLFHSFWAQFGWMGIPVPDRYYWGWGGLTLLALGGLVAGGAWGAVRQAASAERAGLLHASRYFVRRPPPAGGTGKMWVGQEDRGASRQTGAGGHHAIVGGQHLMPWFLLVLVPLGMLAELLYYNLSFEQAQGRYLFPALTPLATLAVAGWSRLAPRPWRKVVPLLLGIALALVNGVVLLRVLTPAFAS